MKMHEIFEDRLLPMMEYVGWLKTTEGSVHHAQAINDLTPPHEFSYKVLFKAHHILDQKMDIGWFVRPVKPELPDMRNWAEHYEDMFPGQQSQIDRYEEDLDKHENWQPMFEGEWEIRHGKGIIKSGAGYLGELTDFKILNDFATRCFNSGIELIINKEYELNENYEV